MTLEVLREHQSTAARHYLHSLLSNCVRKFQEACILLHVDLKHFPLMQQFWSTRVDLSPLLPLWYAACDKYIRDVHDGQLELFRGSKQDTELFSEYIYWELWKELLKSPHFVRDVLIMMEYLPSTNRAEAGAAIVRAVEESTAGLPLPNYVSENKND